MSTKTTFKRVALVAVAALGLGTLSVAPAANAATSANATFTAPATYATLAASVGTGALDVNVGAIQIDLSSLDSALSTSADSASVTVSAFDSSIAKDVTFAAALSLSLTVSGSTTVTAPAFGTATTGYNALQNSVVTVPSTRVMSLLPAAGAGLASGKVYLNLARSALATTDTGAKVKFTLTVAGANVVRTLPTSLTLTIGTNAGTATVPTTTGTVAAGGTVTATYTQPYTNVAANDTIAPTDFTLTTTIASGAPTFSVTAAVTGGSGTVTRTSATVFDPALLKNAITGDLSVTYTISVTVPSTAAAGETVSVYGFTWTVQPYTPVYNNSVLTPTVGSNGYRVSTSSGGDGFVWALASDKTNAVVTVAVQQKDQNGANITAPAYAKTVSATITGKGSLAAITGADVVVKTTSENAANGLLSGNDSFVVYSDGTSGEGKLEISVDGVAVGSYTLRFLGDAASIKATLVYSIGNNGGATTGADGTAVVRTNNLGVASQTKDVTATSDPAIAVSVLDANGWAIPSTAPVATSSVPTVVSAASRLFIDSGVTVATDLKYSAGTFVQHYSYTTLASKSGSTSSLTFTFVNGAGTALVSPAVTVTVGGALASAKLAFDKTSYSPGAEAILTATGLDKDGNKAYDAQDVMKNGMLSTLSFTTPSSMKLLGGTKARTVNAPLASGTWTVTAYDSLDRAYTATATITNVAQEALDAAKAATDAATASLDAASEATDAANAATDAANAAAEAADASTAAAQDAADAVTALATQVAEMMDAMKKQITALTNLVIKIQKKVKA